jgi:lipoate-protein ligase A
MNKWRLIDTDIGHPYYVTAAEEAICTARSKDLVPDTIHFYRREPPGVSVGYFKKVEEDVNVEACQINGVVIVRRLTGGGTIFTDKNQLIYSIITKRPLGVRVEDTFKIVCNALIKVLRNHNINGIFKPPNDILLNGKKISGSAQTIKKDVAMLHGTILLGTDLELMSKVLRKSDIDFVTTIEHELGKQIPSIDEIKNDLIVYFEELFKTEITKNKLTPIEKEMINNLLKEKYNMQNWNLKR